MLAEVKILAERLAAKTEIESRSLCLFFRHTCWSMVPPRTEDSVFPAPPNSILTVDWVLLATESLSYSSHFVQFSFTCDFALNHMALGPSNLSKCHALRKLIHKYP